MSKMGFSLFLIITFLLSNFLYSEENKRGKECVDLAFFCGVAPPRLKEKLKVIYPKEAKEKGIGAKVYTEIIINKKGTVVAVFIKKVILSQKRKGKDAVILKKAFGNAAKDVLLKARFFPPVVQGKNVAVKMSQPLEFKLK